VLLAVAVGLAAGLAGVVSAGTSGAVPRLVFPLVGPASFRDDFGEARAQGWAHPGIDIVAPRKAIATAAEPGTVKFWTTSASAGCMLYLYGESGTTYQYIHLNNDLGPENDNRGRCVAGVAYAPGLRSGAHVDAGEAIGFVGDSGDANGIHPHLHFEVHPNDGPATDPFKHLKRALRLLFPTAPAATVTLTITGTILESAPDRVTVQVAKLRAYPVGLAVAKPGRLVLALPAAAQVDIGNGSLAGPEAVPDLTGRQAIVLTQPAPATLDVALGRPGAISAARLALAVS
jgi:murein DD-endopeptidase MepM/ murein hydrolase activator NlpD